MAEVLLDARKLRCPLPVVTARQQLLQFQPGDILTVLCNTASAVHDLKVFCFATNHAFISSEAKGDYFEVRISKGSLD